MLAKVAAHTQSLVMYLCVSLPIKAAIADREKVVNLGFLVACNATLHFAMSVGWLVDWSVPFLLFSVPFYFFSIFELLELTAIVQMP